MDKNLFLYERAKNTMVGGVNSPVRSFNSVGTSPLFIKKAFQQYVVDENDKQYLDFVNSWGANILGHSNELAINAANEQIKYGFSYGTSTKLEVEMSELLCSFLPGIEMVRMVNSGTEACMTSIRLARGITGKRKVIKFEGCYHGHSDSFLIQSGSGLATLGKPSSQGIPNSVTENTVVARYNDIESIKTCFEEHKGEIAAIIVEPVAGNMGCIPPQKGFLGFLREISSKNNTLLIFDEVMCGFRVALGGAQERYGILADIVTYGKIIGGGLPVAAVGGKRSIMEHLSPIGDVYQAGTLSGNPLGMKVGYAIIKHLLENPTIYEKLEEKGKFLEENLISLGKKHTVPLTVQRVGAMISVFFTEKEVNSFSDINSSCIQKFNEYFRFMLEKGVFLPPSAYESWFLSASMTQENLDSVIKNTELFFAL